MEKGRPVIRNLICKVNEEPTIASNPSSSLVVSLFEMDWSQH